MKNQDIHPITDHLIPKSEKENLLGHKGLVFWLYGLSGSGKSTLVMEMEKRLHALGRNSIVLDGDNLRSGINADLGFSDDDREENVRRVSEIAKILSDNGLIVFVSLITPLRKFRENARSIIGTKSFREIFVKASFDLCRKRDVKGLYAKAEKGIVESFTGHNSNFEEPENADLTIMTENEKLVCSSDKLAEFVLSEINLQNLS